MTDLALSIHGHFYQPPRENPFTGTIPVEPGAEPFHNFNEKVHCECYKPNAELGNLELISFNFGPTLARWLLDHFPSTHHRIIESDRYHRRTYGVTNSIAQAYNHTILPLNTHRDKMTQIAWGVADYQHRFGHAPQGMWLPEMAVDLDTLVAMKQAGIQYTILCPAQVRHPDGDWVDSRQPCHVRLPNGEQFTVFVRDEEISNRLAFDQGLTENAAHFAQWCRDIVSGDHGLYLIATDGETYGHHQPKRQFFLQSLLRAEAAKAGFRITTPEEYIRRYPHTQEVVLVENTAWSCAHGVARWSTGCPCTPGDQRWKPRLRTAFDRLSGGIDALYQLECRRWIRHPWKLRNSYINVILGKMDGLTLLQQYASEAIPRAAAVRLLQLLEAQRYSQAMYTRIETRNNIACAAMAVELTRLATGVDLSASLRSDLATAQSWIVDENGRDIYDYVVSHRQV